MNDDAISRQAVLKLLYALPPEEAITKAMLIQSVKQMDAEQPEQRGIPCGERLPEKPGRYLATVEDLGSRAKVETALFDGDDFWENVRAWMPLPEPYKGEP